MDILIKNMKMPKSCYSEVYSENGFCPFHCFDYHGGSHCTMSDCKCLKTRRPKDCPLVEVEPHGNLKDENVIKDMVVKKLGIKSLDFLCEAERVIVRCVEQAPTILEAST